MITARCEHYLIERLRELAATLRAAKALKEGVR